MSFLKPFGDIKKEYKSRECIEYIGDVEDNNDPKKLGRLRVRIAIYEDIKTEQLPWCFPSLSTFLGNSRDSIDFGVPEIGSQVKVYFPTQDIYHPFYKGADLTEDNKCSFFDEDYPNSYGWKDSVGNFFRVNKTQKTMQVQHSSSSNMLIEEDGKITVTQSNGSYFVMDKDGNVTTHCKNLINEVEEKITMTCTELDITASAVINMSAPEVNISTGILNANTPLVNASGQVKDYKSTMDTIRYIYDLHMHIAPHEEGSTSPPAPQM